MMSTKKSTSDFRREIVPKTLEELIGNFVEFCRLVPQADGVVMYFVDWKFTNRCYCHDSTKDEAVFLSVDIFFKVS